MSQGRPDLFSSGEWIRLSKQFHTDYPHIAQELLESEDFRELRLKSRPDGTVIAVLKKYGADGGPMVLFGVGYDVVLALMALSQSSLAGAWKVDKPWKPNGE